MNDLNTARRNVHDVNARLNYLVEVFGDHLREREGYQDLEGGLMAVRYYLMQKHHWLPRDVLGMSLDELRFALQEELAAWKAPKDAL